MGLNKTTFP